MTWTKHIKLQLFVWQIIMSQNVVLWRSQVHLIAHIMQFEKLKIDNLQDEKHTWWSCKLLAHFINHSDKERRRNLHTAGSTRLSSSPIYINLLNMQALWSSPLIKTAPLAEGESLIIPRGCDFFSAGLPPSSVCYKNDISNTGLLAHWIMCSIRTSSQMIHRHLKTQMCGPDEGGLWSSILAMMRARWCTSKSISNKSYTPLRPVQINKPLNGNTALLWSPLHITRFERHHFIQYCLIFWKLTYVNQCFFSGSFDG